MPRPASASRSAHQREPGWTVGQPWGEQEENRMTLTRRNMVLGTAAAAGALALPRRRSFAQNPVKLGFIYVGPIGDYGWTHGHDEARREVEKKFGDAVQTT